MLKKDTFLIAEGKVDIGEIEQNINNLNFALDEGMSDQTVIFWSKVVKDNIEYLQEKLKKVI